MSKELIDYVVELTKEALGTHTFNFNVENQVKAKAYAKLDELNKANAKKNDNSIQTSTKLDNAKTEDYNYNTVNSNTAYRKNK